MSIRALIVAAQDLLARLEVEESAAEGWEEATELRQTIGAVLTAPAGEGSGRTFRQLASLPAEGLCFYILPHRAAFGPTAEIWTKELKRDRANLRLVSMDNLGSEADGLKLLPATTPGRIDHAVWQRIETPSAFALLLDLRRRFNIPADPAMS